ncbi:MAG: hypothetical protein ABJP48_05395 [Erythrobacter sp.]
MAKSNTRSGSSGQTKRSSLGMWLFVLIIAGLGVAAWYFRAPAQGYANVASSYAARVACSCRFVAGRSLQDCGKDKLAGMELVTLVDDASTKSVTARFPLLAEATASYREGYGCVLEDWSG